MRGLLIYSTEFLSGSVLANLLQRKQYDTLLCCDMTELLERIRFGTSSIIILDLSSLSSMKMIIQEIESIISEKMPIILLTPYSNNEKELEEFIQKGYYIVEKPVNFSVLLAILEKFS